MDRMLAMIQHTLKKNCTIIITHNLHLHVVVCMYSHTYTYVCMVYTHALLTFEMIRHHTSVVRCMITCACTYHSQQRGPAVHSERLWYVAPVTMPMTSMQVRFHILYTH